MKLWWKYMTGREGYSLVIVWFSSFHRFSFFVLSNYWSQILSSVKWLLNASSTSTACFLNSTPGLLFWQLVTSPPSMQLVLHLLVWYVIISPIGSCALSIDFQLSVTYDGSCMLSAVSELQLHLFIAWNFYDDTFLPLCHWWYNWMPYQNTVAFCHHCLVL